MLCHVLENDCNVMSVCLHVRCTFWHASLYNTTRYHSPESTKIFVLSSWELVCELLGIAGSLVRIAGSLLGVARTLLGVGGNS